MDANSTASSTLAVPWCRINNCYRASQTGSQFCIHHGWNQTTTRPEGKPQSVDVAHHRPTDKRPGSQRPVAADNAAFPSVPLDLILQVRRQIGAGVVA